MPAKITHKNIGGKCVMCKSRAEVTVSWMTTAGLNISDVCECCAAMCWNKMVPGHMSGDTFTIVPLEVTK